MASGETLSLARPIAVGMDKPEEVFLSHWEQYELDQWACFSCLAHTIRNTTGIVVGAYAAHMPPLAKPIDCEIHMDDAVRNSDVPFDNLEVGVKAYNCK